MNWRIDVTKSPTDLTAWPARVSIPFPRGRKPDGFSAKGPDGKLVPVQYRTLTTWPDGSPRWVQLDFQAQQAGRHVVTDSAAGARPTLPVEIRRKGDTLLVSVGRLHVTLDPASTAVPSSITWEGKALASPAAPFQFMVTGTDGVSYPAGKPSAGLKIEAEGPNRFQASWETTHADAAGHRLLDARFRIEFLAGLEGFSLSYQFFHKLPGHDRLEVAAIEAAFPFDTLARDGGQAVVTQEAYTEFWLRRFVRTTNAVPILLDLTRRDPHVEDGPAVLQDTTNYPWFLMPDKARPMGHAVALENRLVAVACAMRDFEQQRPKTLTVRPGEIRFGIWPKRAGVLSLPQGRSCRQVFHFRFSPPAMEAVDNLLTRPERCHIEPAACWLEKADSVHAGPTWDPPHLLAVSGRAETYLSAFLTRGASRWISVGEMFNYGDVPETGYTMGYITLGRSPAEATGREYHLRSDGGLHDLLHTADHQPPVWANNEYDGIYCCMLEALRARDPRLLQNAQSAARHQIEVDFVHYSDYWQHHRSTPAHTFDHVTTTSSIPSHQWTQGLYYYYAVTGDDDVPEVVRAICDYDLMHIQRPELADALQFDRELGWTVLALVFGYELTAEKKYIDAAKKIIHRLIGLADQKDGEEYEKKHPTSRRLTIAGLGGGFNVNTIPLAVKSYHQATGEKWAYDLVREWVAFGMTNLNDRSTGGKLTELFFESLCYVCDREHTTRYLKDSIWHLVSFFRGNATLGWINADGPLTTKQFTRIYRGLINYLSALSKAGLLEWAVKRTIGEDLLQPQKKVQRTRKA